MDEEVNSNSILWGAAANGLRLGLCARAGLAGLYLQNVANAPLEVLSHVSTHEVHLDWYILRIKDQRGLNRQLRLVDARDRSIAIRTHLEPGEELEHHVDVQEWAKRLINGAKPLASGSYQLFAVYDVANEKDCWLGHLEAGPVTLTIEEATTSPNSTAPKPEG